MFNAAAGFLETAQMLHGRIQHARQVGSSELGRLMAPFVVNASFSIEVFLKAIGEETGNVPWGHDLVRILDELPEKAQELILNASAQLAGSYTQDGARPFPELLATSANAFEEWRYVWEKKAPKMFVIQDAIAVLFVLHSVSKDLCYPKAMAV